MMFQVRSEAGRRLAQKLRHSKDGRPVVLALPRRGVPVGFEIARELVLPAPVAAADTIAQLRPEADEVACVDTPAALGAIGFCYADFHQ